VCPVQVLAYSRREIEYDIRASLAERMEVFIHEEYMHKRRATPAADEDRDGEGEAAAEYSHRSGEPEGAASRRVVNLPLDRRRQRRPRCWDRPSALARINRRLLLGSTVGSEKRSDAQPHTANRGRRR
jgi:hypothetical protein